MKTSSVLVSLLLICATNAAHWNYGDQGPATWLSNPDFPSCRKNRQSPIDIQIPNTVHENDLTPFNRELFDMPVKATLYNNGHTVGINFNGWTIPAGQGNFTDSYKVVNFHMHWGTWGYGGSEHTFNGEASFAELHFVHFNTKYGSISKAIKKPDGLAVLSVMVLAQSNVDNPAFQQLINPIHNADVMYKGMETKLNSINFGNLFPSSISQYYRYLGSLTTPGCFESVTWTVFNDAIMISQRQAYQLSNGMFEQEEQAENNHLIQLNFRPARPLNGRKVYRSKEQSLNIERSAEEDGASSPITSFTVIIASVLFSGLFTRLF